MNLYTSAGWVNAAVWFADPAPFVVALGGRGTGKTYGALDFIVEHDIRFLYMRRTQVQIDLVKQAAFNPFRPVNTNRGSDIVSAPLGKIATGFYHGHEEDNKIILDSDAVGVGVSLSTVSSVRGIDASDKTILLFDEFIAEKQDRKAIKDEGLAFLNAYETFNRNRELLGDPPLKCLLLANTNRLQSDILFSLGALEAAEKMVRQGKSHTVTAGGLVSLYNYVDSPISREKAATVLYRLRANEEFTNMALDNQFSAENYSEVVQRPLQEYKPVASINGVTLWRHKSERRYYVTEGEVAPVKYGMSQVDIAAFCRRFDDVEFLRIHRKLDFSSAVVKIKWCQVWGV